MFDDRTQPETADQRSGSTPTRTLRTRSLLQRASHVAAVFARYGYGPIMRRIGLGRFIPARFQAVPPDLDWPARLRLALQELGPVAIKLGQVLACRPDLLPPDYIAELRKLEDAVLTFPFEEARKIVEAELGRPLEDVFIEFSEEPAAAASLAQVHKARLRDGTPVAVKVQRPDAPDIVETDLRILVATARLAERYSAALREARVVEVALEFCHTMRNELNFYIEAHNTERLRELLAEFDFAKVPRVHWRYSTQRVLTMEWCSGAAPGDAEKIKRLGIDPSAAARNLGVLMLYQVFDAGFFHGDPHPGNVLLQPGERIVFLDCGNCQNLSKKMRDEVGILLLALLDQDTDALTDALLETGVISEETDIETLRMDVDRMVARYVGLRTTDVRLGEAIDNLLGLVFKHRIRVPPVLGAIGRAMLVAEGVCRQLDPAFNYKEVAEEALAGFVYGGLAGKVARRTWRYLSGLARAADVLPRQLSRLLLRANAGGVRLRTVIEDADIHLRRLDVIANRLSLALVVAAFLVSSALIIASERATQTLTPLGAALYAALAGVFGLWLFYSIIRSGRL